VLRIRPVRVAAWCAPVFPSVAAEAQALSSTCQPHPEFLMNPSVVHAVMFLLRVHCCAGALERTQHETAFSPFPVADRQAGRSLQRPVTLAPREDEAKHKMEHWYKITIARPSFAVPRNFFSFLENHLQCALVRSEVLNQPTMVRYSSSLEQKFPCLCWT
jgi:hypothetical protein